MNTQPGDEIRDGQPITIIPPLVADPLFVEAVDDAIVGDPFADAPEGQPERPVDVCDFPSLYIRHRWALECHARRFLSDSRDVDEVVQETYLKLFLAIPEIDTELQAMAFARRVMTNLCIDRYRAAKRRPSVIDLDQDIVTAALADVEPVDPLVQAEDAAVVREALALLSPLHRAALVKREIEEKSIPEIAAELGIPEESVKHLLYRARRALRRLLVGTSVEPGLELSTREIATLANRRLARATLSGANVLIIVVAAALTVVGAWHARAPRIITEQAGAAAGAPNSVVATSVRRSQPAHHSGATHRSGTPATGPATLPTQRSHTAPVTTKPARPAAPEPPAPSTTSPAKPTGSGAPKASPIQKPAPIASAPPSSAPIVVAPPAPAQPAFALNGSLAAVVAPAVSNQVIEDGDSNATALSRFAAPVSGGDDFVLDQTLVLSSTAAPALQLHLSLQNSAGQALQSATASTQPAVNVTGTAGNVAVAGQTTAPDGSTVNVLLVYNSALTHVLSETVSVDGLSTAANQLPAPSAPPAPAGDPDNASKSSQIFNATAADDRSDTASSKKSVASGSASLSRVP